MLRIFIHIEQLDPFGGILFVLDESVVVGAQEETSPTGGDAEGGVADRGFGIVEQGRDVETLNTIGNRQPAELRRGRIQVDQFDEGIADGWFLSGYAYDERNPGGLVAKAYFRPEIVFTDMVSVIARENDDGLVFESGFLQRVKDHADLRVHVSHGSMVGAPGRFLLSQIHLHVLAGLVIDPGCGDIVPIARDLRREFILFVRFERRVVFLRCDERNVRADKPDTEPESFFLVSGNQLGCLFRCLPVAVDEIVAGGLHDDERVSSDDWFLAVRIAFESFPDSRRHPLGSRAVETFCPGARVVGTVVAVMVASVAAILDSPRNPHVVDLADPCAVVAVVLEMLRPGGPVSDLGAGVRVAEYSSRVGIIAGHERSSRRTAVGSLTIGSREPRSPRRDPVDVRGFADLVSVTRKGRVGEVVGDDEENVVVSSPGNSRKNDEKENESHVGALFIEGRAVSPKSGPLRGCGFKFSPGRVILFRDDRFRLFGTGHYGAFPVPSRRQHGRSSRFRPDGGILSR